MMIVASGWWSARLNTSEIASSMEFDVSTVLHLFANVGSLRDCENPFIPACCNQSIAEQTIAKNVARIAPIRDQNKLLVG
jgi:hypothetical protein